MGLGSFLRTIDNETFLMTCGIIVFFIPFFTIVMITGSENMTLHDYVFLFSGAAMGPTGLFAIANDNTMNMKINAVYLAYAAYVELSYLIDNKNGKIQLPTAAANLIPFFFIFFVVNLICLIHYIINFKGTLEERILRGDFKDDPFLKEIIDHDKREHEKEREAERQRIARNEARKAAKEAKKLEKENAKKEAEEKKDI
ncbi:hypothetical protein BCR32DRAFT_297229 [Anaeromyces robustus]|uniref:Uncharacterized protein n=1 Tax=Anaeromyces robustus TaxID=1754192 RepID=A0A1Y1WG74_9FUNG|nr:hypothetical protein BCR32DRAFT_297229 [Anaeromyces robustus]|eukprot:ORX72550.1 hypothetical protein BCR32DRAFT_297229 [Anaeromyces robustus]